MVKEKYYKIKCRFCGGKDHYLEVWENWGDGSKSLTTYQNLDSFWNRVKSAFFIATENTHLQTTRFLELYFTAIKVAMTQPYFEETDFQLTGKETEKLIKLLRGIPKKNE